MKIKKKVLNLVAFGAFIVTYFSTNQLCFWLMYQEELPDEAKKLTWKKKI